MLQFKLKWVKRELTEEQKQINLEVWHASSFGRTYQVRTPASAAIVDDYDDPWIAECQIGQRMESLGSFSSIEGGQARCNGHLTEYVTEEMHQFDMFSPIEDVMPSIERPVSPEDDDKLNQDLWTFVGRTFSKLMEIDVVLASGVELLTPEGSSSQIQFVAYLDDEAVARKAVPLFTVQNVLGSGISPIEYSDRFLADFAVDVDRHVQQRGDI